MQPKPPTEKDVAAAMAAFLFVSHPSGYRDGQTPVVDAVQRRLRALADDIAGELVAANAELRALIRGKVEETIARALADDPGLNAIVTKSVAEALTRHYYDHEE